MPFFLEEKKFVAEFNPKLSRNEIEGIDRRIKAFYKKLPAKIVDNIKLIHDFVAKKELGKQKYLPPYIFANFVIAEFFGLTCEDRKNSDDQSYSYSKNLFPIEKLVAKEVLQSPEMIEAARYIINEAHDILIKNNQKESLSNCHLMFLAARLLSFGFSGRDDGKSDIRLALELFRFSAKEYPPSQTQLGNLYKSGIIDEIDIGIFPKDEEMSLSFFRSAVKEGYVKAIVEIYKHAQNSSEIEELYEETFHEKNDHELQYFLGLIEYEKGNYEKAVELISASANQGFDEAKILLSEYHRKGLAHLLNEKEKVTRLIVETAAQGNHKFLIFCGLCYLEGKNGFENDITKAAEYFSIASQMGNSLAKFHMANFFLVGIVIKEDHSKALLFLAEAFAGGLKEEVMKFLFEDKRKEDFSAERILSPLKKDDFIKIIQAFSQNEESNSWLAKNTEFVKKLLDTSQEVLSFCDVIEINHGLPQDLKAFTRNIIYKKIADFLGIENQKNYKISYNADSTIRVTINESKPFEGYPDPKFFFQNKLAQISDFVKVEDKDGFMLIKIRIADFAKIDQKLKKEKFSINLDQEKADKEFLEIEKRIEAFFKKIPQIENPIRALFKKVADSSEVLKKFSNPQYFATYVIAEFLELTCESKTKDEEIFTYAKGLKDLKELIPQSVLQSLELQKAVSEIGVCSRLDQHLLFLLGQFYKKGIGVEKNEERAQVLFEENNLYVPSQYALGDYELAAGNEYPPAQFELANQLIETDFDRAVTLCESAVNQEYAKAQNKLASLILESESSDDFHVARNLLCLSAQQLYEEAQNNFAYFCEARISFDESVSQDDSQTWAFQYYNLAAKQGNSLAKYNLAQCYEVGFGVEANLNKAIELYFEAAQQGVIPAKVNLAKCLVEKEEGVENFSLALKYFSQAIESGDENVFEVLQGLKDEGALSVFNKEKISALNKEDLLKIINCEKLAEFFEREVIAQVIDESKKNLSQIEIVEIDQAMFDKKIKSYPTTSPNPYEAEIAFASEFRQQDNQI